MTGLSCLVLQNLCTIIQYTLLNVTPFMANNGMNPSNGLSRANLLSDDTNVLGTRMAEMSDFLTSNLEYARDQMKKFADHNQYTALVYEPGDKVMLLTKDIKMSRPKPNGLINILTLFAK